MSALGQKRTSTTFSRVRCSKADRPSNTDQRLVRIGQRELIRTPRFDFWSIPKDFIPEDRRPVVDIFHTKIKTERISARNEPITDRDRQMKLCVSVREYSVSRKLIRPRTFDARKPEATIEAFGQVKIAAR